MLEGFIREDREGTIAMLNAIRPKDVIEHVLGRALTPVECDSYLLALSEIPADVREAFRIGQVWQDLTQASRKFLQGRSLDSKNMVVGRLKSFLRGMKVGTSELSGSQRREYGKVTLPQ
jgi:hypothetical protein